MQNIQKPNATTNDDKMKLSAQQPQAASNVYTMNTLSPDRLIKRFEKDYEDIARFSLDEINRELDLNMNEIMQLLNRRKSLIMNKRKKLKGDFRQKFEDQKTKSTQEIYTEIVQLGVDDPNLQKIVDSSPQIVKMQRVIQSVSKDLSSNTQGKQKQEIQKSTEFWQSNKSLEQDIDNLLKQLKYYDQELENSYKQVQDICRALDQIEDNIRQLLVNKTEDSVKKAEPLFLQKQQEQEILKSHMSQRSKIKDEKIALIGRIIESLQQLQTIRQERMKDLINIFGIDDKAESSVKISYYIDFVDQLENLAKIKDMFQQLEQEEVPLEIELDKSYKENDALFSDLIKKYSDEARQFAEYHENLRRRLLYKRGIEYFMQNANLISLQHMDIQDILKKFKENIVFLKPFVEEDVAIKQGLAKTNDTISTFINILKANENEKERRRELIHQFDNCYKLKKDGENKQEFLREIDLEVTKKKQQRSHLDEEIDNIITDADLDSYKRLENVIKNHDGEFNQLQQKKSLIQREIDEINIQVINQMNGIKTEFDDILREVLSNNLLNTIDFQQAKDIRYVQNYIKKTFNRLGLCFGEESKSNASTLINY